MADIDIVVDPPLLSAVGLFTLPEFHLLMYMLFYPFHRQLVLKIVTTPD
jgi:hypothetical protein